MEKKITDETILSIIEDYTDTDTPVKEIAAKYNIAASSVYYVLKRMDVPLRDSKKAVPKKKKNKTKEETKKIEVVESTPSKPKSKFSNIGMGRSLVCGLVSERHEMPANITLYIYERYLNSNLMFNFDEQYRIAREFIIEHIFENSMPVKDLIVYCTGIQSALAAVIKAAYDLGVNLILAHYDAYNKKYRYQLIWGDFTKESPINNKVIRFINVSESYQYYNCTYIDLDDTLFVVTFSNSDVGNKKVYVCASMADTYDLYLSILKKIGGRLSKFALYADEYTIEEDGKLSKNTLIKSNNYN